ncbi:hypothetical protein BX659_1089 [Orenia metallireducens]|jgi:hypothetical protein|uniref:Uncharacterized protein n=1 Tax=Orenia metallireducens TaxID=1413210 RepID=A0A285GRJ1_9FIRM|nr:hypothetical protein [Orenia metallireducens]PRX29798.1 hypothetical protein BX659_1089 [Orenia metallireducens]SNY24941.1 hypothetical protein SAMN06265827_1099 [Orenia metallireducens]
MELEVKRAKLDGHEQRKLEDMEIALNLDRDDNDQIKILAVEEE